MRAWEEAGWTFIAASLIFFAAFSCVTVFKNYCAPEFGELMFKIIFLPGLGMIFFSRLRGPHRSPKQRSERGSGTAQLGTRMSQRTGGLDTTRPIDWSGFQDGLKEVSEKQQKSQNMPPHQKHPD